MIDPTNQRYPKPGDLVNIIQKQHYATGELTSGVVKDVLTKKRFHPRGHKVRLINGIIGRVQSFVDEVGEKTQLSDYETQPASPDLPKYFPGEDELV